MAHGGDLLQYITAHCIVQLKPVLRQVNAQHGFRRIWLTTSTGLWIMRLNQGGQPAPEHDLFHVGQETLTSDLLAFAGVFEIEKLMGGIYWKRLSGGLFQHGSAHPVLTWHEFP